MEEAQKEGLPITAETCHHYLNLNSDEIPDSAAEFKCCPPVRDGWHREKLWDAVKKVRFIFLKAPEKCSQNGKFYRVFAPWLCQITLPVLRT